MMRTFDMVPFVVTFSCSLTLSVSLSWLTLLTASNILGAAEAMNFINEDVKAVVEFGIDWGMKAALAATSTHAFIVLAKKFLD
jgi:hypothetical protein